MPTLPTSTYPDLGPRVAASTHPIYDLYKPEWIKLGDVREGTGGFTDGTYLVAHPREWEDHTAANPKKPSKKLKARRALARYENLASGIMETKKSALFREQPTRRVGTQALPPKPVPAPVTPLDGEPPPPPKPAPVPEKKPPSELELWWDDVDGRGTHIDDAVPAWWDLAATFGHVVLYFELPAPANQPLTAADQAWPYVRVYTPLDVINWLSDDNGQIISLKVIEAVQATTYNELRPVTQYRVRIIDQQGWAVYDYKSGTAVSQGQHGLGRLPVAFLYGKRRAILSDVGQSVLGDPRNYIDIFNLTSELRELLRNQTFSFINLPLGTGPDAMTAQQAKDLMGEQIGTMNVLLSGGTASVLTADSANVDAYHDAIEKTTRGIYREAGVQWETDTKDAEAEGSLSLKREEMNTRLSAYADECQAAEYVLAELWYLWRHGADSGKAKFDDDQVVIHYPDRFTATPFDEVLQQVQAAQAIGMPAAFLKELRKAIITKFEGMGNLTPEQLQLLNDAIDQAPDDPTPAERLRQKMELLTATAKSGGKVPPVNAEDSKAA